MADIEIEFPIDLDDVVAAHRVAELCEKLNWTEDAENVRAAARALEKFEKEFRREFVKLEGMRHKRDESLEAFWRQEEMVGEMTRGMWRSP